MESSLVFPLPRGIIRVPGEPFPTPGIRPPRGDAKGVYTTMKDKRNRTCLTGGLLALSLGLTLALAACGSPAGSASQPGSAAPGSSAPASEAPTETPSAPAGQTSSLFQAGTWLSDQGQYWFFDAGEASGRTAGLEDGTGVPFAYTFDGAQAVFSIGIAGNDHSCDVTTGENTLTLRWEDGATEVLTYVSDQGSDQFQFHSNRELEELALAYYQAQNPGEDTGGLTAAAQTNEDGTVTIQVYRNLGDHNSNAAWYTVDRVTGQGSDGNGQAVDLDG